MKYLLSLFLISFSLITFAQNESSKMRVKSDFTAEQEAILKTKKMTLQFDLNSSQQQQILEINKKMIADHKKKMEAHKAKMQSDTKPTSDERFKMMNDMLDAQIKHQNEMKKILKAEQYEDWKKSNKYKMAKMRTKGMKQKAHATHGKKKEYEKQKMKKKQKS
jgi:hypothetical protein